MLAPRSHVSPVLRLKATHMTHVIAEYFATRQNVLMLVDSLTRVAMRNAKLAGGWRAPTAKAIRRRCSRCCPT